MCPRQEKLKSLQKERDYALQLAESKEPPVPVFRKNSKSMNCQFQPAVFWKEPAVLQFSQFCRPWLLHTSEPVLCCFENHGYKPKETP